MKTIPIASIKTCENCHKTFVWHKEDTMLCKECIIIVRIKGYSLEEHSKMWPEITEVPKLKEQK